MFFEILVKIARILGKIGDWYMRRRGVVKYMVFFAVFLLLPLIYSYLIAEEEKTRVMDITNWFSEQKTTWTRGYGRVLCRDIIKGMFHIAGVIEIKGDVCYVYNETTIFYFNSGNELCAMVLHGNGSVTYVLVVDVENYVIGNETVETIVYIARFRTHPDPGEVSRVFSEILVDENIRGKVCSLYKPSDNWGVSEIYSELYSTICSGNNTA